MRQTTFVIFVLIGGFLWGAHFQSGGCNSHHDAKTKGDASAPER